jgi:DNA-binding NtrC family response regulator
MIIGAIFALLNEASATYNGAMDPSKIYILVLDRDAISAQKISQTLVHAGYQVSMAFNESDACILAEKILFNLVVKSYAADQVNAILLMEKMKVFTPDAQFIFIGSGGTIRTAVECIKKGVFDYLSKPVDNIQLLQAIKNALEYQALVAEDVQLKLRLRRRTEPNIFAGNNRAMQEVNRLIEETAPTDVTILIQGESGTGKEIVARAIHEKSRRKSYPFIAVNCAALPENLIEAELFGHVRGAFTGAFNDRQGRFQLAKGGTLFLDEIGDLCSKGQGDLLRVLEDGNFRPVGSQKIVRATARIIAATHRNLEDNSVRAYFREDLYYRLNVVTISIPPLRERAEDIPSLVESFGQHFCLKHKRKQKTFSKEVIRLFQSLPWPGNVRQLRNIIERIVVTMPQNVIQIEDLPSSLVESRSNDKGFFIKPGMSLAQLEAELIRQTLLKVTSNRNDAAQVLGISRRALQYKIKAYGLSGMA